MTRVLMVDDDEDIRKIGRLSLEAVGKFETVVAASVPEALEVARRHRPDVILMDLVMPGTDGVAGLALIRSDPELQGIPVVFLTAKVQRAEIDQYLQLGALGVIQKPFDPMTLHEQLRRILAGG